MSDFVADVDAAESRVGPAGTTPKTWVAGSNAAPEIGGALTGMGGVAFSEQAATPNPNPNTTIMEMMVRNRQRHCRPGTLRLYRRG